VGGRCDDRRGEAADGRLPVGGLLEEQAQLRHALPGSAVLLGQADAQPSELGHLGVQLLVVRLLTACGQLVPLLLRAALAAAELADRVDEVALLVGQGSWHGRSSWILRSLRAWRLY